MSSALICLGNDAEELISVDFAVFGSSTIVGTAQVSKPILIQNGSQIFQLIVAEAIVGPMNDTTYDVELMYEK